MDIEVEGAGAREAKMNRLGTVRPPGDTKISARSLSVAELMAFLAVSDTALDWSELRRRMRDVFRALGRKPATDAQTQSAIEEAIAKG
jgi:hypothetical protein